MMYIFLRVNGTTKAVMTSPKEVLKLVIDRATNNNMDNYYASFEGMYIDVCKTVEENNLVDHNIVEVLARMKGGMFDQYR